jgi:predicted MPP superfamily phosphohydrolase
LAIGLDGALHIREERLSVHPDPCRLMYVSDLHLRPARSQILARHVIESARSSSIDAWLLGGDLVDRGTELAALTNLVRSLRQVAPVLAVGGNHDEGVGLNRVRDAVVNGGGQWIHDATAHLSHQSRVIAVSGPDARSVPAGDVRILCAHTPRVWSRIRRRDYDLVLAGHLHGCQFVAWNCRGHLYPGALFYRNCCLTRQDRSSRLVVSRGVSDLIPIRWRCPREVILCYV